MSILTEKYDLFKYDTATSANIEAISAAGVYATAQGANTITFSAMNSKPTIAVSFIVQFQDAITI